MIFVSAIRLKRLHRAAARPQVSLEGLADG
jgi:hypothetical protein